MKNLCKLLGIKRILTTAYQEQSNGRLERIHHTICRMLCHFVNNNQSNWDEILSYVTMAYNSQIHETTGYSPFELLYGRKMRTPGVNT